MFQLQKGLNSLLYCRAILFQGSSIEDKSEHGAVAPLRGLHNDVFEYPTRALPVKPLQFQDLKSVYHAATD